MTKGIRTVQLGQFTDEHANEIAGKLEAAGIVWWFKQPGYFARIWEKGTRLFVDDTRLEEAQAIARSVLDPSASQPGSEGRQDLREP